MQRQSQSQNEIATEVSAQFGSEIKSEARQMFLKELRRIFADPAKPVIEEAIEDFTRVYPAGCILSCVRDVMTEIRRHLRSTETGADSESLRFSISGTVTADFSFDKEIGLIVCFPDNGFFSRMVVLFALMSLNYNVSWIDCECFVACKLTSASLSDNRSEGRNVSEKFFQMIKSFGMQERVVEECTIVRSLKHDSGVSEFLAFLEAILQVHVIYVTLNKRVEMILCAS